MSPTETPRVPPAPDDVAAVVGHPRGTLAIVLIFGVLFVVGWFGMYLFRFMGQGAPHH